jgi:hypothetical protein
MQSSGDFAVYIGCCRVDEADVAHVDADIEECTMVVFTLCHSVLQASSLAVSWISARHLSSAARAAYTPPQWIV